MCQTYKGWIEGWLESVSGLYKSLIERKKKTQIEGKFAKKIKMSVNWSLVNPIGTLRTCSSTVFRAWFRYDDGGMENPHKKIDLKDFLIFSQVVFFL